ncbi:MAG: metallophosphoesterase family protein [Gemmatimonadales bacterium]
MKYALISDIHANLPALQAVLADIRERQIETVLHIGDLVGYAPWPNETVQLLLDSGIDGVAGNYDSTVATDYKHCGCHYTDPHQQELAHLSYQWTRENVTPDTKAALGRLPFRLDVSPFGGHTSGPRVILVHGTPTLNTQYWYEHRSDEFCLSMAVKAGAKQGDVIAFGHTHLPWAREIDGIRFINTGSVGRPKDGDWRAGYVALDVTESGATSEYLRVEYDVQLGAKAIRASSLPSEFADYLLAGGRPQ